MNKKLIAVVIGLIAGSLQCADPSSMAFRPGTPPRVLPIKDYRQYDHTQLTLGNGNWHYDLEQIIEGLFRDQEQLLAFPQNQNLHQLYTRGLRRLSIKIFTDTACVVAFTDKLQSKNLSHFSKEQVEEIVQRYFTVISSYKFLLDDPGFMFQLRHRVDSVDIHMAERIINEQHNFLNTMVNGANNE